MLKQGLEIKQTQKLSPLQFQTIKLIELPIQELEQRVKAELEEAKARNGRVILATHIPPFAFAPDEKNSYDNYPLAGRAARLEAYAASGARFFLTAHLHRLSVRGYRNVTMLGTEATCSNFDARPHGFRLFDVADQHDYSYNFFRVRS